MRNQTGTGISNGDTGVSGYSSCNVRCISSLFNTDYNYLKSVVAYFWKRWTGISKFARNTAFLEYIYDSDFLEINRRKGVIRRVIGFTVEKVLTHDHILTHLDEKTQY